MLDNHQNEYVTRIHKVQDYIEENYGKNLSTEELAVVAGFSKYHFNRIFKSVMQEPLSHYVNRIRMEQAVFMLAHFENKNITDIAYELGFTDSAIFSRAFKNYYGLSPIAYRKKYSTNCKDSIFISTYNKSDKNKKWVTNPFPSTGEIRIESVKECQVIYVRHTGTYCSLAKEYERLVQDLFRAASKQELLHPGKNQFLALYHDNPEFGKEEQFRTSLCMTFPESCSAKEDGELGVMTIDGGLYAVGHFEIVKEQFEDAWDYMYQKWLLTSGYVPRNAAPFEVFLNNPKEEKEHLIKVEIYMPIEPI
jgi:AraC family transcriptional regulator